MQKVEDLPPIVTISSEHPGLSVTVQSIIAEDSFVILDPHYVLKIGQQS